MSSSLGILKWAWYSDRKFYSLGSQISGLWGSYALLPVFPLIQKNKTPRGSLVGTRDVFLSLHFTKHEQCKAALQLLALSCMLVLLKSHEYVKIQPFVELEIISVIYCLTTNLVIHSSAGRTLCQLDFEVPLIHIKTHQASKWEKKMPLKNGCLLNLDHLLVWHQVAGLCHRTRNIYESVLKLSDLQASYHHHSSFPHMQKCVMVQLYWSTYEFWSPEH